MAVASQFVLYRDDSVEVSYLDGSRLELTPCGTTFVHYQPPGHEQHPLHGVRRVQQRSRFATSEFHEKVIQGLEFRNRFAERPYICRDLLQPSDVTTLHASISEACWPNSVEDTTFSQTLQAGITITSTDGYSLLTISPCRQQFSVRYLARLSQAIKKDKTDVKSCEKLSPTLPAVSDRGVSPREEIPDGTISSVKVNNRLWQQESSLDGSYREILLENEASHSAFSRKKERINRTSTPNHLQDSLSWHLSSVNTHNLTDSRLTPGGSTSQHLTDHADSRLTPGGTVVQDADGNVRWEYVWLVQFCSVEDCPDSWKHPLQLAFQCAEDASPENLSKTLNSNDTLKNEIVSDSYSSHGKKNDGSPKAVSSESMITPFPRSLPLNCPSSHLHRFKSEVEMSFPDDIHGGHHKKVKVLYSHGIIYRLLWKNAPRVVEIFPGDGSVLKSQGSSGNFFTHTFVKEGQVEERVHSVKCPPPKIPGASYSVANLIKTGSGLLYTMIQDSAQLTGTDPIPCWQVTYEKIDAILKPVATILLEESVVAGLGRFSAYSNGYVRVVFEDRTCLETVCDFSRRVSSCLEHSQDDHHQMTCDTSRTAVAGVLLGQCRLLLPNAQYVVVSQTDAGQYSRYVQAALEWAGWVNSSPSERYLYYKDTIYDADKCQSVTAELMKISCFNYIVENTVLNNHQYPEDFQVSAQTEMLATEGSLVSGVGDSSEEMNLDAVRKALLQTASAINDIDQLLGADRKESTD